MHNYKPQLLEWLKAQESTVDSIIYEAAQAFYNKHQALDNFDFDLAESQKESFNLKNKKDLCYDRITTPFVYSLWYQGRRVNSFLPYFIGAILDTKQEQIALFDLGAGTGAVQMAIELIYYGLNKISGGQYKLPKIRIINVDSSPLMLQYHEEYICHFFSKYYPMLESIEVEYSTISWNNKSTFTAHNTWITANYLFDISDNKADIDVSFDELVKQYKPNKLILITSNQSEKIGLLNSAVNSLAPKGYQIESSEYSCILNGNLNRVNSFRTKLASEYNGKGLRSKSFWKETRIKGLVLESTEGTQLSLIPTINLYNPPIKDRIRIELSKKQQEAAKFKGRPSIIIGAAGSGKTVVITEKVAHILREKRENINSLRILITTFNKELSRRIGNWMNDLLENDNHKITRKWTGNNASDFYFNDAKRPSIKIMHFDLLPVRLGAIKGSVKEDEDWYIDLLDEIAKEYIIKNNIKNRDHIKILNGDYLFEEHRRYFYGLDIRNRNQYYDCIRKGRGNIGGGDVQRHIVYDCILEYYRRLKEKNISSFIIKRRRFLHLLKLGNIQQFDYLIVDEFQDCTQSDYHIFHELLNDVNNLTIAGDVAQSVHIGKSADIPRDSDMAKRKKITLEGSYRLPQNISRAIMPISREITKNSKSFNEDDLTDIIRPVKDSPPGARPIVVYGMNDEDLSLKIKQVIHSYGCYGIDRFSILEKDRELTKELRAIGLNGGTDTILRLKGMEKPLIIWSTRAEIADVEDKLEFIYTILTRTSSVLVVALFEETISDYEQLLKLLNKDLLIFWDKASKSKFEQLVEGVKSKKQVVQIASEAYS